MSKKINLRHYKWSQDGLQYTRDGETYCGSPALLVSIQERGGRLYQKKEPIVEWYKVGKMLSESVTVGVLGPKSAALYWKRNAQLIRKSAGLDHPRHRASPRWVPIKEVSCQSETTP